MNILLYLISKNYRRKVQEGYTKNLLQTFEEYYTNLEDIYKETLEASNSKVT